MDKTLLALALAGTLWSQPPAKSGVNTPGVRIPIALLKPEVIFDVAGSPDWIAVDESVWISNMPKDNVARIDPKANSVAGMIPTGKKPCSGLAAGFGSLWVPNCGDQSMSRIDLKTGKVTATFPMQIADSEGGIAVGAESVWLMTDRNGTLARIDPARNQVIAEIYVPPASYAVAFGEGSVWVTGTGTNVLTRVDPRTNLIVETIPVGKKPRFLAVGEGAVWTLNQGDGTVSRVDPKINKVIATIEAGIPGPGGDIAAGEGSIWVTSFDFPLTRIDPGSNRAVQQFSGPGGDAIRTGLGSIWLSNYKQGTVWRIDPRRVLATLAE